MRINLDYTDETADWPKARMLDWPLDTEDGFRRWMSDHKITPEHVRTMALFTELNRLRYPWLDKLAGL